MACREDSWDSPATQARGYIRPRDGPPNTAVASTSGSSSIGRTVDPRHQSRRQHQDAPSVSGQPQQHQQPSWLDALNPLTWPGQIQNTIQTAGTAAAAAGTAVGGAVGAAVGAAGTAVGGAVMQPWCAGRWHLQRIGPRQDDDDPTTRSRGDLSTLLCTHTNRPAGRCSPRHAQLRPSCARRRRCALERRRAIGTRRTWVRRPWTTRTRMCVRHRPRLPLSLRSCCISAPAIAQLPCARRH